MAAVGLLHATLPAAPNVRDTGLEERIERLLHAFLSTEDDAEESRVEAEVRDIFSRRGLPSTAEVGEKAAYEFVVLASFGQPLDFQIQALPKVKEAAAARKLPADSAVFYEARVRFEQAKDVIKTRTPANPDLRDEIERLIKADQAVRQQEGFDLQKMVDTDRETAAPLKAIFDQYGVPTFDMVGFQAAGDFVVMVQHQPAEFRQRVLPKLKANVDAGQADPTKYPMVYDRSQRDQGKRQRYGEQLECRAGKQLEEAPIEDPAHVNLRRAELGLMRVELYAELVKKRSPPICGPASH